MGDGGDMTATDSPSDPCGKCGGGVFYRLRGRWHCLVCEGLVRCPVPERWTALPLPGVRASRRARLLAERWSVDLREVPGSGFRGKVVAADVRAARRTEEEA